MSLDTAIQPPTADRPLTDLTAALSLEEKVRLVVGAGLWSTTAIPHIGLRAMHVSDGPAGVRGVSDSADETSASFPAPSALAATWDVDLADEVGHVFAAEARRHGVDVVLAPQVNLQRTPVGGRHFECYSEDPLLTGAIAVHVVRSAQDRGVGMCVKHFVANDSETQRTSYLARVDEQTLREVYLAPFEQLVHEAQAWSVMSAYSGIDDGTTAATAAEHRPLLTGVLKDEWGFDGVVMSDWVATTSVVASAEGGLDLQMPGPDGPWGDGLLDAVRSGDVSEELLDAKVLRLLRLAQRVGALDGVEPSGAAAGPGRRRRRARRPARAGLPLDGRAPRRRARAARRPRRRHPDRPARPQRRPPVRAGRRLRVRPSGPRRPRPRPRSATRSARSRSTCTPARCPACCRPRSTWPDAAPRPTATRERSASCSTPTGPCWSPPTSPTGPAGCARCPAPRSRCACAPPSGSTSPAGTRSASAPSASTGSRSAGRCSPPASTWSAPRSSSTPASTSPSPRRSSSR